MGYSIFGISNAKLLKQADNIKCGERKNYLFAAKYYFGRCLESRIHLEAMSITMRHFLRHVCDSLGVFITTLVSIMFQSEALKQLTCFQYFSQV